MASVGSLGTRPGDTQQATSAEWGKPSLKASGLRNSAVSVASLMYEVCENVIHLFWHQRKINFSKVTDTYSPKSFKGDLIKNRLHKLTTRVNNHTIHHMKSYWKGIKTPKKALTTTPSKISKCYASSSYKCSTDTCLTLISWAHLQAVLLGALGARPESSVSN